MKRFIARKALATFTQFRVRVARIIYDRIFVFLIRDENWREKLFISFTPGSGDRVLNFGPHSSFSVLLFALHYPAVAFCALDTHRRAAKSQRRAERKRPRNVTFAKTSVGSRLPFDAGSFDKIVCVLGLHDRPPRAKLATIKDFARVLRRGGTLHVIDFDKPQTRSEGRMLEFAGRIWGPEAVASHLDGSWVEILTKGGFAGVRRQPSYSIGIGRLSVIRARKR